MTSHSSLGSSRSLTGIFMGKPGSVAATVRKTGSTRFQKAANRCRDNRILCDRQRTVSSCNHRWRTPRIFARLAERRTLATCIDGSTGNGTHSTDGSRKRSRNSESVEREEAIINTPSRSSNDVAWVTQHTQAIAESTNRRIITELTLPKWILIADAK